MPYVTVGKENSGNIDLYYEDHGSGKPIVLIHGYPLSGASWEKQVPVLLAAGHRVITYDRRGFGKSSQPTTGYNYDTFAADLHKLVTQLELTDFALVGFSMGGGEVARYLGKYGSKGVSKAVIISGVPPFLLKTAGQPGGRGRQRLRGDPERPIAADRYAFFTEFLQEFLQHRSPAGEARQRTGGAGQLERRRRAPLPRPVSPACRHGTRTSARTWPHRRAHAGHSRRCGPDSADRRLGTADRQADQGRPPGGGEGWAALHNLDTCGGSER